MELRCCINITCRKFFQCWIHWFENLGSSVTFRNLRSKSRLTTLPCCIHICNLQTWSMIGIPFQNIWLGFYYKVMLFSEKSWNLGPLQEVGLLLEICVFFWILMQNVWTIKGFSIEHSSLTLLSVSFIDGFLGVVLLWPAACSALCSSSMVWHQLYLFCAEFFLEVSVSTVRRIVPVLL